MALLETLKSMKVSPQNKKGGLLETLKLMEKEKKYTPIDVGKLKEQYFGKEREPIEYKPTPVDVSALGVIKEIPSGIRKTAKGLERFGTEVGQSIARSFTATSKAITNLATGKDILEPFTPYTEFEEMLVGEEPVNFESIGREVADIIGKGQEVPTKVAVPLGLVFAGLDIIPIGGSKLKSVSKTIARLNKTDDIIPVLKRAVKGGDDEIKSLAKGLEQVSDPKAVERMIKKVKETPSIKPSLLEKPKIAKKERKFIQSTKKVIPDVKDKVAGRYVPRITDNLAVKARNLVKEDITTAERIARTRTDENAVAVASELIKHYGEEAIKTQDMAAKNALLDQAAEISNIVAPKLTEQGRSIQAASILGRLTPEGQVRFASKEILKWNEKFPNKAVPELTGEQANKILEDMRVLQDMPDGTEKAIKFQELQEYIKSLVPSRWWEKAISVWKAGLLTGIKTSGLNVFSNLAHMGSEIIKDVPAAITDFLLSLITGKRTKVFTFRKVPSGLKEGAKKGWRYLKTGFDERNIAAKLDYKKIKFKNKAVQKYVDTVFRVLGTEDQPFYYGALKRSFHDQALAQARNQGLKGRKKTKFVKKLMNNPTDNMVVYATTDAETAVYQNRTALGTIARGIQRIPGLEFIVPFGRTPSAVATQIINYSPAGTVIEVGKQITRGSFDQRLLSQAIGRSITGTVPLWLGSQLYKNDLLSLDYPKSERERELWKTEGRKSNSIKVGDKWRTVQVLGPVGPTLLLGGHFIKTFNETGSPTEAITQAAFGTVNSFTEQTFLRGVDTVMNAIMDPERSAEYAASSWVSSFVPTIISDIGRSKDEKERRSENVVQRTMWRIPILRERLEPQITVLGEERERGGNILETMADPTRPIKDISDPVVREIRRLYDEGYIKAAPTKLGYRKGYDILSQQQNTQLWKRAGEITREKLTNLIISPKYQELPDDKKSDVIDDFTQKSKTAARAEMTLQLTEELEGEELKNKLSELKKGNLITRQVFNLYSQIR